MAKAWTILIPLLLDLPYGLVVRIPAFHAGGPGSIPGVGTHFVIAQTMRSGKGFNYFADIIICVVQ